MHRFSNQQGIAHLLLLIIIVLVIIVVLVLNPFLIRDKILDLFGFIDRPKASNTVFITRSGPDLYETSTKFKFSGANMSWLGLQGDMNYPSKFRIEDSIVTAKEMGTNVIRSFGAQSVGCPKCIEPSLGNFNSDAFQSFDYAIKVAGDNNIRFILPLVDNWHFGKGGKHTFTDWRGLPSEDAFYTDPTVIQDFKDYIAFVLNHVNPYTNLAYKDDPTIMAWETGNELDKSDKTIDSAWTENIANYIKSIAPNQLVVDGHSTSVGLNRHLNTTNLAIPSVDIYTGHFYPPNNSFMQTDATLAKQNNKVYFVGEYDWSDQNSIQPAATITQDSSSAGEGTKSAKVDVTQATVSTDGNIQLRQQNRSVTEGVNYTVSFWAKASVARTLRVVVAKTASPYTSYFSQTVNLTTSWQQFSFNHTQSTDDQVSLVFNVGKTVSQVWVDGASLADSSGNIIQNPSFEDIGGSPWYTPWIFEIKTNTNSTLAQFLPALEDAANNVAGSLYWTLFSHDDIHGFWYMAEQVYAMHYTGDSPDMENRAQQIRSHAYRLRGLTVPAHSAPGVFQLNQVTTSGSNKLIDWRGSVGAKTYSIERQVNGSGSWQTLVSGLTDYQAPWTDNSAVAGTIYSYRVKASNYDSSLSTYSDIQPAAGNQIQNSSFEHSGVNWNMPWLFQVQSGAAGILNQDLTDKQDGIASAKVDITQASSSKYLVQFYQPNLSLVSGKDYTLTFWAKASAPRSGEVVLQQTGSPYTSYFRQSFDLTTSWQQFSFNHLATTTDSDTALRFNLAEATGQVWLDNIVLSVPPAADSTAPTTSITSPTNNSQVSGTVSIQANASDNVGVTRVEFFINGSILSTDTSAPYTASWNTTSISNNSTRSLTTKAYDGANNIGTSSTINVTVKDITAPSVSITSPANNALVPRNSNITISASASDASSITKVEFYVNGTLKCTDTTSPYSCSWKVPTQKNKTYTLLAKAYDTVGNSASSSVIVTSK